MKQKHRYGVEAGRTITRDGVHFVSLNACKNPTTGASNFAYAEADDFAHEIVRACNAPAVGPLIDALKECITCPGSRAEESHELAIRRLVAISKIALDAISQASQQGDIQ